MELISKDEAMRRFKPFGREIPKDQVMAVLARIDEGIVRCEDCIHYDEGICWHPALRWHPAAEVGDTLHTEPTDYCSYGERKEEIQGLEYAENILDSILREQEEGEE